MVQQRRRRGDRIGAEEHRQVGKLRAGDQAKAEQYLEDVLKDKLLKGILK